MLHGHVPEKKFEVKNLKKIENLTLNRGDKTHGEREVVKRTTPLDLEEEWLSAGVVRPPEPFKKCVLFPFHEVTKKTKHNIIPTDLSLLLYYYVFFR